MPLDQPSPPEIRPSQPSEVERALEITLAAYVQYERSLSAENWEFYRQHIIETLADIGAAEQLMAVSDGSLVGTVLFYPPLTSFGDGVDAAAMSPDCPEVRLLAVAPAGRGLGVGRALMAACVDRARSSGAPGLVLHTMVAMTAARSIYDSMGFERAPELDFQPLPDWFVEGFRLDLKRFRD